MNSNVKEAATNFAGYKLLRNFRMRWLLYGAAAYVGLRFMSSRGIMKDQADAALDVIDRGINAAKERVGFGSSMARNAEKLTGERLSH